METEQQTALREQLEAVTTEYWTLHEYVGSHGYKSRNEQRRDMVRLGRLADTIDALSVALIAYGKSKP